MFRAEYTAMSKEALVEEVACLRDQLEQERKRANSYAEELRLAKEQHLVVQKQVEQEEEYITNKLMKRLEQLKREKQILATEVEQEEEFLTNTLQKRLEKLNQEKVDLENRLEAEQEYIVNKLHKQLEQLGTEKSGLQRERTELARQVTDLAAAVDRLGAEKVALEQAMEMEEESIVNRLQRQLESLLSNYRQVEAKLEARGLSLRHIGVPPIELPAEAGWAYGTRTSRAASRASSGELSRSSWSSSTARGGSGALSATAPTSTGAAGGDKVSALMAAALVSGGSRPRSRAHSAGGTRTATPSSPQANTPLAPTTLAAGTPQSGVAMPLQQGATLAPTC